MYRFLPVCLVMLAACGVSEEPVYLDRACDLAHPCPDGLACYSKVCTEQTRTVPGNFTPATNPDGDDDGDGLTNGYEAQIGTDPANVDTDRDYVNDDVELAGRSDPLDPNKDGDKLIDGAEYWSGTDSNVFDTDGDGIQDGDEDADGDGYSNYEETSVASDPRNPAIHP